MTFTSCGLTAPRSRLAAIRPRASSPQRVSQFDDKHLVVLFHGEFSALRVNWSTTFSAGSTSSMVNGICPNACDAQLRQGS